MWRLVLLSMAVVVGAQAEDIHQRLMRLLGPDACRRADILFEEKRFAEVEAMLPEREQALRGVLEFMSGHMEAAAKWFQDAEAVSSLQETDRFTLAMSWVRLGRDKEARDELIKLSTQYPSKTLYAYWMGRLDYDQRRYKEAVEHFRRATTLDSESARAWDGLGLAYDMQGNAGEALDALQQAASLNREQPHPSAWPPNDLAALLLRTGDAKKAELALHEAIRYDPSMQVAHYHLARALDKQGANDEALQEYLTSIKLDDKSADVYYSLAMLYRRMNRSKEAEAAFAEWRRCKAATLQ